MTDTDPTTALINDLRWQIGQMKPRGIKDSAGNPYNPSYYKRGLENAISGGGTAVADYVKRYLTKPPSAGYRKLEDADSLDLACEALVADETKPYAHLFSDEDRAAARARLDRHLAAIAGRRAATADRIAARKDELPGELAELRRLAAEASAPEDAAAVNAAILEQEPDDVPSLNRLGRAHEALGSLEAAQEAFERVLELDGDNAIARRRLDDVLRRRSR